VSDVPRVDPERDHVRGDGPYELLLYGDYECPYTRRAMGFVGELERRYGSELRFAFRHLPLSRHHPHAQHAAEAAEAAAAQGGFWALHERLFAHPDELSDEQLAAHAEAVGLDGDRVAADLASGAHAARVREDAEAARAAGLRGTPAFVIGGERHEGFYDVETLSESLEYHRG
jgi:Na+:H+ antiporter, NhaA family